MWTVIRTSPEGYKGYKHFETVEAAKEWLECEHTQEDREYGYSFTLVNEGEKV